MEEVAQNNQAETSVELTNDEVFSSLSGFNDLQLNLKIILGKVSMPIGNFLKITRGTIIEIGKNKNDLFEVNVNKKNIALCDIFVEGEKVFAEVKQIIKPREF